MASWYGTGRNRRRPRGSKSRAKILPRKPWRRSVLVTLLLVLISSMLCCTPSKIPMRRRQSNTRPLSDRWFTTVTPTTSSNTSPTLLPPRLLINMHDKIPLRTRPPTRLPPSLPITRAVIQRLRSMPELLIIHPHNVLPLARNRRSDHHHRSTHRLNPRSLARTR
jgi:hypothetical protein